MIKREIFEIHVKKRIGLALLLSSLTVAASSTLMANNETPETPKKEGYQAYAYYEGVGPQDERSGTRKDGTTHGMPCITKDEITAGEEKKYDFWHGHNRELHRFTINPEQFEQLKQGKSVDLYTEIVDGHRHAVRIDVKMPCKG